jgi:hypothetical protein
MNQTPAPLNYFRLANGDGFLQRAIWSIATGVVPAVMVLSVQNYMSAGQASASSVVTLEVQMAARTEEMAGIVRGLIEIRQELARLNENIRRQGAGR